MHRLTRKRAAALAIGLAAGAVAGSTVLSAVSGAHVTARRGLLPPRVLATHVPPALTAAGEVVKLRYDIYCVGNDDPRTACDAGGTVYVRAGTTGASQALALKLDPVETGRYFVKVPAEIRSDPAGFSYYAVLRDNGSGAETTLPSGGAAAPQRSVPLGDSVVQVDLGVHDFGVVRTKDKRVVSAAWGAGSGDVGLENAPGPDVTPIGASAFDVSADGTVTVLDEAHRRALRWSGGNGAPSAVPLSINGTIADMSVDVDGSLYVLETTAGGGQTPLVRTFDAAGRPVSTVAIVEPTAPQIRVGSSGPVVLERPSGQWMSVGSGANVATAEAQAQSGTLARPLPDGKQVIVYRQGNELRIAIIEGGSVTRSWQITSSTPMAEVQLAQPLGKKVVVVLGLYTETNSHFVALVLGGSGIVKQFSLNPADWAETAPLTRFRLVGSSLYQLGSTPAGIFVDRFDLGVS